MFVTLKRTPESLRQRVQDIAGVDQVEARVMAQVRLDMPDFSEPVTALMMSVTFPRNICYNPRRIKGAGQFALSG